MPFTECKVVDSENRIVPVNTDGELCIRGYNVMKGYWNEPVKTAETIDSSGVIILDFYLHINSLCTLSINVVFNFL